jgi:magnesium transporter
MSMTVRSLRSLTRQITYDHKNRAELFTKLELRQQSAVILMLSRYVQGQLLKQLSKTILLPILESLEPDDATDLLQTLPKRKQSELVTELSKELRSKISLLLQFDPQTAAGLMSLNYIQIDHNQKIADIGNEIHIHESRTGKLPIILVMVDGKLGGYLPVQTLVSANPHDRAREYVESIAGLKHTAGYQAVIDHFLDHPHKKAVVLAENDAILGVIYSDDVLRAFHEREASNLYDFAGVSNEETVFGTIKQKVQYRYKWLIINLGTAFMASLIVGMFNETIAKYVLLAVYMPIVAGMGGNAATQTLAVMVRGIALNQISLENAWPTLRREVLAALIHGVITGVLVAAVVLIFNRDFEIALILAVAMVANLVVAGFFGTLVPLVMTKLGKDPATSATIFITTATDVLGFLVFLGLATLMLR